MDRHPVPVTVLGQAGWGLEQPGVGKAELFMVEGWNEMNFRLPSKQKHSLILWFLNTSDHNGTMISRSGFSSGFQVMNVCLFFLLKYFIPSFPRLHLPWSWLHDITHSQPLCDLIILSLFPLSFPYELTSYSRKFY